MPLLATPRRGDLFLWYCALKRRTRFRLAYTVVFSLPAFAAPFDVINLATQRSRVKQFLPRAGRRTFILSRG